MQVKVDDGTDADKLLETLFNAGAGGQIVQIPASVGVLGGAPLFDCGIVPVFQPAVVVADRYAVVFVADRTLGRAGRRWEGRHLGESAQGQQEDRKRNTSRVFHRNAPSGALGHKKFLRRFDFA